MALLLRSLPSLALRTLPRSPALTGGARMLASYPKDRVYRPSHEWAKVTDGVATVGITQHAQEALGDIVFADLPAVGTDAVSGETAATVESVKAAADIYAPVSGEVVAVNEQLEGAPELINSDPHDDGWMFQIRLADPADKLDGTMDAAEYEATILEDA